MTLFNKLPLTFDLQDGQRISWVVSDSTGEPLRFPLEDVSVLIFQSEEQAAQAKSILADELSIAAPDISLGLWLQGDIEAFVWESQIEAIDIYFEEDVDSGWIHLPKRNFSGPGGALPAG